MTIFLTIVGILMVYAFLGAIFASRHHAIAKKKCGHKSCWAGGWCEHCLLSVWGYGVAWPFVFPVHMGTLIGGNTKESRVAKRRAREIAEAKHKAEVARIAREEDEELDKRLAALESRAA